MTKEHTWGARTGDSAPRPKLDRPLLEALRHERCHSDRIPTPDDFKTIVTKHLNEEAPLENPYEYIGQQLALLLEYVARKEYVVWREGTRGRTNPDNSKAHRDVIIGRGDTKGMIEYWGNELEVASTIVNFGGFIHDVALEEIVERYQLGPEPATKQSQLGRAAVDASK